MKEYEVKYTCKCKGTHTTGFGIQASNIAPSFTKVKCCDCKTIITVTEEEDYEINSKYERLKPASLAAIGGS